MWLKILCYQPVLFGELVWFVEDVCVCVGGASSWRKCITGDHVLEHVPRPFFSIPHLPCSPLLPGCHRGAALLMLAATAPHPTGPETMQPDD